MDDSVGRWVAASATALAQLRVVGASAWEEETSRGGAPAPRERRRMAGAIERGAVVEMLGPGSCGGRLAWQALISVVATGRKRNVLAALGQCRRTLSAVALVEGKGLSFAEVGVAAETHLEAVAVSLPA